MQQNLGNESPVCNRLAETDVHTGEWQSDFDRHGDGGVLDGFNWCGLLPAGVPFVSPKQVRSNDRNN